MAAKTSYLYIRIDLKVSEPICALQFGCAHCNNVHASSKKKRVSYRQLKQQAKIQCYLVFNYSGRGILPCILEYTVTFKESYWYLILQILQMWNLRIFSPWPLCQVVVFLLLPDLSKHISWSEILNFEKNKNSMIQYVPIKKLQRHRQK